MDDSTRRALLDHNRRFYAAHAGEFDAKRERPWPGFARAFASLPVHSPLRVLDLGCGNARLATELAARVGSRLDYLGLDSSAALLEHAQARLAADVRNQVTLRVAELFDAQGVPCMPEGAWDLVTLLGVLHHVPDERCRRALIHAAFAKLTPGGRLVLTVWRFLEEPRLRARVLPFDDARARARALLAHVAPSALEPGDALLRWGSIHDDTRELTARYCHAAAPAEVERWLHGLPAPVERFLADGASGVLNEYIVLAQPV